MRTPDDLNANADATAALYDEVGLYTNGDVDAPVVATGGTPTAVTFTAGGAVGPLADHAAVDGIAWSSLESFTLTETATHFGLLAGGNLMRLEPLRSPVGPGTVPFVCGVGPAATS